MAVSLSLWPCEQNLGNVLSQDELIRFLVPSTIFKLTSQIRMQCGSGKAPYGKCHTILDRMALEILPTQIFSDKGFYL